MNEKGQDILEILKIFIPAIAVVVAALALIANFPNYEFGLSIESTKSKVDPGDVITNTIHITNNKPISWWTRGTINQYPFSVALNVKQPSTDILTAFIPDTGQKAGNSTRIYIGVKPNAAIEKYELEIEGVGSDGIKRTCTYYLLLQGRKTQDNESRAIDWGEVGFALINDGYRCHDALPWFENALKFDVKNFYNWEGKADCLTGLRNYTHALAYADNSLSLNSNGNGSFKDNEAAAMAYEVKGVDLFQLGNSDKNEGDYQNSTKRYKEAIECFDNATYLKQNYFWALYWKGYTYCEMRNYTAAMDSFNESIRAASGSYTSDELDLANAALTKAKELRYKA